MNGSLLPIGSVVLLQGEEKRVMVTDGDAVANDLLGQIDLLGPDCPPEFRDLRDRLQRDSAALEDMFENASQILEKSMKSK